MAQSAGYKKRLSVPSFWQMESVELPLELSKWAVLMEMAVFASDGIEVRVFLRPKPPALVPNEPTYEVEITGKTEAQKRNRDFRNQEKRVTW